MVEELYIIDNGEKIRLDIGSETDITLEYKSNIFGDLSKVSASHSYTFNLPKTANNMRALDAAHDIRHKSSMVGKKLEAQYLVDGIPLFERSYLYVQATTLDSFECCFTWNVVDGLDKINDKNYALNELGNYYSQYDYDLVNPETNEQERDLMVYMGDFTTYDSYLRDKEQPAICTLHKAGVNPFCKAFIYRSIAYSNYKEQLSSNGVPYFVHNTSVNIPIPFEEMSLSKLGVVVDEAIPQDLFYTYDSYSHIRENRKHYTSSCLAPPVVPVAFLIKVINEVYGVNIKLNDELSKKLCVPLVSTKTSEAITEQNYVRFVIDKLKKDSHFCRLWSYSSQINSSYNDNLRIAEVDQRTDNYASYPQTIIQINTTVRRTYDLRHSNERGLYFGYGNYILTFDGFMDFIVEDTVNPEEEEEIEPVIDVQIRRTGDYAKGGEGWVTVATLKGEFLKRDESRSPAVRDQPCIYRFDMRRSEGREPVNTSVFWAPYIQYVRFEMYNGKDPDSDFDVSPYDTSQPDYGFKMYQKHADFSDARWINVFQNLPSISTSDFIKSLGFITGTYPISRQNGDIEFVSYGDIEKNLKDGNIVDWSDRLYSKSSEDMNAKFGMDNVTSETMAQKNYFLMKNDELTADGVEKPDKPLEDVYEHSFGKIIVNNETLEKFKKIYELPFYGAFKKNGKSPHVETYLTQSMWTTENGRWYKYNEAKPILATIEPIQTKTANLKPSIAPVQSEHQPYPWLTLEYMGESEHPDMCTIKTWQFPENMEDDDNYSLMCKIYKNPILVEMNIHLTEYDLYSLDFSKPVYIERYNSLFAVVSVNRDSSGVCRVKMLKIPTT